MTALAPRPRSVGAPAGVLVDAALDGDEAAWARLCELHLEDVRTVAHARLRDAHAAEDVVQETLLRAWCRLHQLDDPHRLGAWLKTIAANVAVDHVRRRRSLTSLDDVVAPVADEVSLDEHVIRHEEASVLHSHLAELREVDRRALWQRDGLGVPVSELADELGMTPGSVRVLLTRARTKVRSRYGLLVAPLLGLATRQRARLAGLGEAVPVAVMTPVLVVAAVVGATVPDWGQDGTDAADQVIDVAPEPAAVVAPVSQPAPPPAPEAPPSPVVTEPVVAEAQPTVAPTTEPTADDTGPGVRVGDRGAGFREDAPIEGGEDVSEDSPAGPVEGLDVYFEDTLLDQECVLC